MEGLLLDYTYITNRQLHNSCILEICISAVIISTAYQGILIIIVVYNVSVGKYLTYTYKIPGCPG